MKWRALILGGGGPVGEFQIGAIQAIAQRYDSFNMYVGVGCGSLNTSVLAQFDSLKEGADKLIEIWDSIRATKDIFSVPFTGGAAAALAALISESGWARDSIYGYKKLTEQIKKHIDWELLKGKNNWATEITSLNDGQRYTVTNSKEFLEYDKNPLRTVNFSLNEGDPHFIGKYIYELLTAGGCTPLMLPPIDLFDHRFAEGGIRNCTPFPLAVKAYELARSHGYDEAEFIVVNNYVNEPNYENNKQLDSGMEIIGRTIKMMTIEIAQNELFNGKVQLEKMGAGNASVIAINPTVDYRLSPFNFNDLDTRKKIRNHGIDRANLLLPPPPPPHGMMETASFSQLDANGLINELENTTENIEAADKIVSLMLSGSHVGIELEQLVNESSGMENIMFLDRGLSVNRKSPHNLSELIDIMKTASANGQKIKAVGQGFAFDNITHTTGIQVQLDKLHNIWKPELQVLKDPAIYDSLFEFESGATIDQLNKYLWSQKKALINQPGYEGLTFAGVANCGGHGSGIMIPPLADAVMAINLLTFNSQGKLLHKRIEAANGISDPVTFKRMYPGIELIQDDKYFKACKVSVGLLGIIYSLTIRTQPAFYLEENRVMQKWNELKKMLPGKLADKEIHSIHIWFNPYPVKGEIHCVLSEYRRVENRPNIGKRGFGVTFGLVPQLAPLILWTMRHFHRNLGVIMNSTLKATTNKYPYVMECPEALNFGSPNLVSVDATNCGIPADNAVEVAEELFKFAAARYQKGAYITSPIGFRFTSSSDNFLAPQYKRQTCMIEMPLIKPTPGATETINTFLEFLIKNFEGKPHWGQRFDKTITPGNINSIYPELQFFKDIFKEYNYNGIFNNEFTQRIGLSQ